MSLNNGKKLVVVNSCLYEKKSFVCLSVCLTVFESADARDLSLMTLFFAVINLRSLSSPGPDYQ